MGLTAEYLKKGRQTIVNYTAALLNAAKKDYNIPEVLKTGLLTPVLKKEKDHKVPGNYRGIAVIPVLGKILESILFFGSFNISSMRVHSMADGSCVFYSRIWCTQSLKMCVLAIEYAFVFIQYHIVDDDGVGFV
jgi:hypothetical protein